MKKLTRYLQKQALQYSDEKYSSAAYLSPRRNNEPQQHVHHHAQSRSRPQSTAGGHDTKTPAIVSHPLLRERGPPPAYERKATRRGPSVPSRISSNVQRIQYGSANILQSYEVYIPPPPPALSASASPETSPPASISSSTPSSTATTPAAQNKYWVVFIHGGYFRDPSILASSFHPTIDVLTSPPSSSSDQEQVNTDPDDNTTTSNLHTQIAGYVSINYRLSPHPAHPQSPDTTPTYELNNAKWPAMLDDILAALAHFQTRFRDAGAATDRYLLVGHSVGATLAMNALLRMGEFNENENGSDNDRKIRPPAAVLGVSGIYDFVKLHEVFPGYREMTRGAVDEGDWERVSVARVSKGVVEGAWGRADEERSGGEGEGEGEGRRGKKRRYVVLAHSKEDTLVDWGQVEAMQAVFDDNHIDSVEDAANEKKDGADAVEISSRIIEIKGSHNACWEDGRELARVILEGLRDVTRDED